MASLLLFDAGLMLITPAARDYCTRIGAYPFALIARHCGGDFGDLCEHDAAMNRAAIANGDRVLSSYRLDGQDVWVITEADRSSTTVLLPSDY